MAKKEHAQIVELLKYIQQLPPGLYGMQHRGNAAGRTARSTYEVTLVERKVEDLRKLQKYDRVDEKPFEAVAALSELYRARVRAARAAVRARDDAGVARQGAARPASAARAVLGAVGQQSACCGRCRGWRRRQANRRPRSADNDFVRSRRSPPSRRGASLDLYRDLRDAASEAAFFQVYGNMMSLQMADEQRGDPPQGASSIPARIAAVREVLDTIEEGSAIEGLARIAMLIAKAGSGTAQACRRCSGTREL